MPGPMSSPSGDRRLLNSRIRESERNKGTLVTGKTALARSKGKAAPKTGK
jgi:hypothetical protein